jgi:hypothetical protein
MCHGEVQGSFAQKFGGCLACDFYMSVKHEEGAEYLSSPFLLKMLQE